MILSQSELIALTERSRRSAQVKVLRFMGVDHRTRPDGSVAVLRSHVERVLDEQGPVRLRKSVEPNWGAI